MKKIFLDLGRQPLANDFKLKGENEFYNLKLEFDQKTKLISINKRFNKKICNFLKKKIKFTDYKIGVKNTCDWCLRNYNSI